MAGLREPFYYDPKRRTVRGAFYVNGKRKMHTLLSFDAAEILDVVRKGADKGKAIYKKGAEKRSKAKQLVAWHEKRREVEKQHPAVSSMTVADAAKKYLSHIEATRREKTQAMYKATVDAFLALHRAVPIHQVRKEHLDRWLVKQKQRGVSNTTINLEIRQLRTFLNWCVHQEWLVRVPWLPLEEQTRRDTGTIPPAALQALVAYLEKERVRSKAVDRIATYRNWWRLVILEMGTGARPGEARSRRGEDFDWDRGQVRIRSNSIHHVKKSLERMQPIQQWAVAKLRADWEQTKKDDWFLQKPDGSAAFPNTHLVSHGLQRMWGALGYDNEHRDWKGAHGFRFTMATELIEAGADAAAVQHVLGHTQLSTTMAYNRRREAQKRRAIETVDFGKWLEKAGA